MLDFEKRQPSNMDFFKNQKIPSQLKLATNSGVTFKGESNEKIPLDSNDKNLISFALNKHEESKQDFFTNQLQNPNE